MLRAVIFDLYDTLIDYDEATSRAFSDSVAAALGLRPDQFTRIWRQGRPVRETGPLGAYLETLGLDPDQVKDVTERRLEWTRSLLARPRDGAIELLQRIRRSGLKTGLITVCSEDLPLVWEETPLAPLIDAAVFSCTVGFSKPDPRIYLLACERLAIEPREAVFVGDGANDELAGAERVGMSAVLIRRRGVNQSPDDFRGPRISQLGQLADLLDDYGSLE